jgi:hypothetical protein
MEGLSATFVFFVMKGLAFVVVLKSVTADEYNSSPKCLFGREEKAGEPMCE